MRIGHGFDAHAFTEGRPLILGGINIPHEKGLAAHSDGDAVIHALCDALLGAAALGDIGAHFPDSDPEYRNIDSRILLRNVKVKISDLGYEICNADITILAQAPRLSPYLPSMRDILAVDMGIDVSNINIKATTTEKMGFVGRGEGISVFAVVLLDRQ
jgi:2-C-methyl-D-erythritol 2,4-cyclodiphosphate synthase